MCFLTVSLGLPTRNPVVTLHLRKGKQAKPLLCTLCTLYSTNHLRKGCTHTQYNGSQLTATTATTSAGENCTVTPHTMKTVLSLLIHTGKNEGDVRRPLRHFIRASSAAESLATLLSWCIHTAEGPPGSQPSSCCGPAQAEKLQKLQSLEQSTNSDSATVPLNCQQ